MKENKGITLVALIITIIVMLILVSVTVSILINSNVIGKAKDATKRTETAYANESNFGEKLTINIGGETFDSIDKATGLSDLDKLKALLGNCSELIWDTSNPMSLMSTVEQIDNIDESVEVVSICNSGVEIEYNGKNYYFNVPSSKVYENYIILKNSQRTDAALETYIIACDERLQTWADLITSSYDASCSIIMEGSWVGLEGVSMISRSGQVAGTDDIQWGGTYYYFED